MKRKHYIIGIILILGGIVSIDSELNKGTTFRIQLPLTLATFRGIFVQISGQLFVIPTLNVEKMKL